MFVSGKIKALREMPPEEGVRLFCYNDIMQYLQANRDNYEANIAALVQRGDELAVRVLVGMTYNTNDETTIFEALAEIGTENAITQIASASTRDIETGGAFGSSYHMFSYDMLQRPAYGLSALLDLYESDDESLKVSRDIVVNAIHEICAFVLNPDNFQSDSKYNIYVQEKDKLRAEAHQSVVPLCRAFLRAAKDDLFSDPEAIRAYAKEVFAHLNKRREQYVGIRESYNATLDASLKS